MKDKAVLFFSRDGSTRAAARIIADKIDADVIELREQKARRSFLLSGFKASTRRPSALAGDPWAEIRDYPVLILGSPIWAGKGNPAMNGFLDKADLSGKKVFLFTVQADPGKGKSDEVLAHYSRRVKDAGGTVVGTIALTGAPPGKTAEEAVLRQSLSGWDLPK